MNYIYRILQMASILALVAVFVSQYAFSQGVTTAAMNGLVVDQQGEPLPGANVVALHVESGTVYGRHVRDRTDVQRAQSIHRRITVLPMLTTCG